MPKKTCDVVHIVNQLRPGGIETMVLDITRHSRYDTHIFSLENSTAALLQGWPQLDTISELLEGFEKPSGLVPSLPFRLAQRLRELRPQALFLHRINPLLYGGLAARMVGIPRIIHVEHDVWQYENKRRLRLLKLSTRIAKPIHFAVSPAISETLHKILPKPDVRVVPGGVDLNRYQKREAGPARIALGLPSDASVIGTAGRLEPVKGHSVLIAAMPNLSSNAQVVIVGEGSQRQTLLEQASELGVQERLHLLGHRDDLELILPAMDVFCLPSLGEGLPRVIMEAQCADIPIVASDVGAIRQITEPKTGRLVAAGDPIALAEALNATLAQPKQPGICRAYAEAHFSIDKMVAQYDNVVLNGVT